MRFDQDVDQSVVPGDRPHARFPQEIQLPQVALGLAQQPGLVEIAAAEQQLRLDRTFARVQVQPVCQAVQRVVFARIGDVEDLPGAHRDGADARAGRLECGVVRQRRARIRLRRRPAP